MQNNTQRRELSATEPRRAGLNETAGKSAGASSVWKHGEPPNSDVELARCGVGRVFVRYSDACGSLICGADFGSVSVAIVSINSRST